MPNGNICIGKLSESICDGNILIVDMNGEKPIAGRIKLKDKLVEDSKLIFEDKYILSDKDGELVYTDYIGIYQLGEEVTFDPGDGVNTTWNVIGEDEETLTIMLSTYLIDDIVWGKEGGDGTEGPVTLLTNLNTLTSSWTIDSVTDYTYINELGESIDEYQKLKIKNGVITITDDAGVETQIEGVAKARLLTSEEFYYVAEQYNENYNAENLINYINSNLEKLSSAIGISPAATSAQNLLSTLGLEMNAENLILVMSVLVMQGMVTDYNFSLPTYLINYSTISSVKFMDEVSSPNYMLGYIYPEATTESSFYIKPVITIQKSVLRGES